MGDWGRDKHRDTVSILSPPPLVSPSSGHPWVGVVVGYVDRNRSRSGKGLLNVVSLIVEGRILHTQAKTLLPTYDVFDEARWFEPARERKAASMISAIPGDRRLRPR